MTMHKLNRTILSILILLIVSQIPFSSTPAQQITTPQQMAIETHPDLLIILSPQYHQDTEIHTAIHSYLTAVKKDLGWNAQIVSIHQDQNTYQYIDHIIETAYENHPLKACIMVGEDLDTPLAGDCDYLEQPSTLPWITLGETNTYDTSDQAILCKPTKTHLCISLLYPTSDLSYEQKKSSLLFAFDKFTTQRNSTYPKTTHILESSDLNTNSKKLYQQLNYYTTLTYTEDATEKEVITSLADRYAAFFVHGHSTPAGTDIHRQKNTGWFTAEHLDSLNTPLFGADGCYTAGWWSNQPDNNHLDPSITATWYGSKIFTSPHIQVLALGLLSQNGFTTPVSFIENVMPELLQGKTLAEAMIGDDTIGDTIIVGDPTFHFTF